MKVKQRTLKSFEFDIVDDESFFLYFKKNFPLLKSYLILLKGNISPNIINYLFSHKVCFIKTDHCHLNIRNKSVHSIPMPVHKVEEITKIDIEPVLKSDNKIYYRPIRSGEEIRNFNSIVLFDRINSGAKVIADGTIEVFGTIEGTVICHGSYMLITSIAPKGDIIFHNETLDKTLFDGTLMLVTYENEHIRVKKVIS